MITVKTYLYPNTAEVQVFDPTIFTTRNRQVYSRPIKVYQGIDNPIQIIIKNQDQKTVNLTGFKVQLDIQDPLEKGSVASLAVTMTDITKGLGNVTIPKDVLNVLEQRFYKITIKKINATTNKEEPFYIDDNYGACLDLEVLPGWYESTALTTPPDEVVDGGII